MEPFTVSISEGCHLLGIGRTKFYELINQGHVSPIKVGRRTLVPLDSLRKFLDVRRMPGSTEAIHVAETETPYRGIVRQDGDAKW
jgi:excisionase family DNA binding protein